MTTASRSIESSALAGTSQGDETTTSATSCVDTWSGTRTSSSRLGGGAGVDGLGVSGTSSSTVVVLLMALFFASVALADRTIFRES